MVLSDKPSIVLYMHTQGVPKNCSTFDEILKK